MRHRKQFVKKEESTPEESTPEESTHQTKRNEFGLPNIVIPTEVLFHSELSSTEKILFGIINNLSATKDGCWACNRYLANFLNLKIQTISNAISTLKNLGFLEVIITQRSDGMQVRRIFIDKDYLKKHESMLMEAYKKINRDIILKKSKTPIKKIKDPYEKSLNNIDKEIDKEIGNNSLLHKDSVSSKHLTSINRIISFWNELPKIQKHFIPETNEDKITKTYKTISLHIDNLLSGKPLVRNQDNSPFKPYKEFLTEYKIPSVLYTMTWTEKDIIDLLQIFSDTQPTKSSKMSLSSVFWNNFAKIRGGGFSWFIHIATQTDLID